MLTQFLAIVLGLCCVGPIAQDQSTIAQGAIVQPRERGEDRPRRGDRRDAWRERMRNATAEERQQMRLDRWVERTARTYDLDEAQQVRVRAELAAIQQERRMAMGADAGEYDRLQERMSELRAKHAREAGPEPEARRDLRQRMRNDPEVAKLREQMGEIDEKHPFDMEAVIKRVETLLPEEQVKKGQARRQEWQSQRMNRGRERAGADDDRNEWRRRGRGAGMRPERPTDDEAAKQKIAAVAGQENAPLTDAQSQPAERELHPWEKYTREFVARHECSPEQANSAMSILKDVRARAEQLRRANAEKTTDAGRISDPAARSGRLAELNAPMEQLFEELESRLDSLLTAAQRVRAKVDKGAD